MTSRLYDVKIIFCGLLQSLLQAKAPVRFAPFIIAAQVAICSCAGGFD